jgi:DNA-directed RNA polymerase beta subunit
MEDAMILNKGSYERGFAHASVYKTKVCLTTKTTAATQLILSIIIMTYI